MPAKFIYILLALGMLSTSLEGSPGVDSLMALLDTSQVSRKQAELRLQIAGEIANDNIEEALALSREALRQAELLGAKSLVAEAKLSIGMAYDVLGVKEEAIGYLEEALEVFTQLGMPDKEASALSLIGNAYFYIDQFETALKYYTKALAIGYALNDTTLIIGGINAKGAVYGNTGPKDSALILFRQANELARQIDDRKQVILTYYNIGDVILHSGRIDDALGIFHDLENNYDVESYSSKHLGNLYNSMTLAFIKKGDMKWAKRYSDTCRIALERYGRLTETREYYHNLYRIDSMEDNYQSALHELYQVYQSERQPEQCRF